MKADDSAIDQFAKTWVAELSKAVEMFSGEAPAIRHRRVSTTPMTDEGAVWIKQAFIDGGSFQTWIGAPEATWQSLGGVLGEGTPESLRATYFEIVNQAQQGSTNVINSAFARTMHLVKPETYLAASFEAADFAIFELELELVSAEIPALILAIELLATDVLGASFAREADAASASSAESDARSIASSLLTLELPVSVAVGQSEVEMKRALTAGPGMVIGLNQESSELVALLVHGRVVARGEMVLVKGNYGFRVKQILNRQDRLAMCKG